MENSKPSLKDIANGPPLLCPICERPNYHPSDHHMIPRSRGGKSTETICQDCHQALHSTFSNKELETIFNTIEKLLTNQTFVGTVKFISKQDPAGKIKTKNSKNRSKKRFS